MPAISTQPAEGSGRRVFHTLDGLRGVAAVVVAGGHIPELFGVPSLDSTPLAVDLFFVLSGFVISHAYGSRLKAGLTLPQFVRERLLRFYPLYFLGTLIDIGGVSAALLMGRQFSWTVARLLIAASLAIFMLPTPSAPANQYALYRLNPPAWSLLFELLVNIFYAKIHSKLTLALLVTLVASSGLVLAVSAVAFGSVHTGYAWQNFIGGIPRVTYSFFAGMLIYRSFVASGRLSRKALANTWVPWVFVILLLAVLLVPIPAPLRLGYEMMCVLILFPILIWTAARFEPDRKTCALFSFLGAVSYALYTIHEPLALCLKGSVEKFVGYNNAIATPWAGFIFLGLMLLLATAAHRYFDTGIRKNIAARFPKLFPRRQGSAPVAVIGGRT